jgi:hypothetical protein
MSTGRLQVARKPLHNDFIDDRERDRTRRPDKLNYKNNSAEKVLEKLATSDKATIVIERQSDGKMRVTSGSWDGEKVILRDQVLEVRNVDGRLHVARKERRPDEWDPPIEPDDPYGPGKSVTGHDGEEAIDD